MPRGEPNHSEDQTLASPTGSTEDRSLSMLLIPNPARVGTDELLICSEGSLPAWLVLTGGGMRPCTQRLVPTMATQVTSLNCRCRAETRAQPNGGNR